MYNRSTELFGIPYISDGEVLEGASEKRAATIIENALFAGVCGIPDSLFEDGNYELHDNGDGTCCVTITSSATFSVCGIVNFHLFKDENTVTYENLMKGEEYLLYAAYQPEMDDNPAKFRKVISLSYKTDRGYVLLARVDLRDGKMVLDEEPIGKTYTKDMLQHMADKTNPHGRLLVQDELMVSENLIVQGQPIHKEIILSGTLAGNGYSVSFNLGSEILHVSFMPLEKGAGHVWCEYHGSTLVIYNELLPVKFSALVKVM